MQQQRKVSEILRAAGEFLEKWDFETTAYDHTFGVCYAINKVGDSDLGIINAKLLFDGLFKPESNAAGWYMGRLDGTLASDVKTREEKVADRILACYLAAEIAESEGL